jgi:2-hydroxy-6-oxonona-2,4-dienedioate hydrolase
MMQLSSLRHADISLPQGQVPLPQGHVHYVEAGTGDPLLLVHGGYGSWTHWIANIEPLARRRRVIALDLPGFGASFNPKPAYSIEQYAAAVRGVLDALKIERAAIAGFSFGCVVSSMTARVEPERISHLAMVNSPGIGPASPVAADIQKDLSDLAVRTSLRNGALESLKQLQLYNHELIDESVVDVMVENVRQTRFVSRSLSRVSDTSHILAEVRQPILVLIGREDIHRQFGLAEALRVVPQAAPQAQIHLVERARHWLQFDRADLFNALLGDFVG